MSEAVEAEYVPDGNENYELVVKVSTASTLIDKTRFMRVFASRGAGCCLASSTQLSTESLRMRLVTF